MAAKVLQEIALSYKVENLQDILSKLKTIREQTTITGTPKMNLDFLISEFEKVIPRIQESIEQGKLDVKDLGLTTLSQTFNAVIKGIAASVKDNAVLALSPLKDEINDIDARLDTIRSEKNKLQEKRASYTPEEIKKRVRDATGITRLTSGGSLESSKAELDRLEKSKEAGTAPKDVEQKIKAYKMLVAEYQNAARQLGSIKKAEKDLDDKAKPLIAERKNLQTQLNTKMQEAEKISDQTLQAIVEQDLKFKQSASDAVNVQQKLTDAKEESIQISKKVSEQNKKEANTIGAKAFKALSLYVVLNQLKKLYQDSIRTIQELDKAMTEAATVTSLNREAAWQLLSTYQELGNQTGLRVSELSSVVNQFLRQGRTLSDALELTKVAAMSAKVAGISASEAVNYLTSAVNGFGLAATQAEEVADKFAAIAARSASSFEELAIAMSKVAPTAQSAGISIDFMMGVLAKGIETTREAPENIGTAFKTVFARMREVTDIGKAAEDGMSLNRVEKALQSIGVELRDSTGQFRNLENVLIDVGNQWTNLTSIEQAYIATALAGTRQQPRLLAIFNDFERTKELIQISADATGELAFQHYEYMQGMEASMTNLKNSWEKFIMTLADSELVIGSIKLLSRVVDFLAESLQSLSDPAGFTVAIIVTLASVIAVKTAMMIIGTAKNILYTLSLLGIGKAAGAATASVSLFSASLWLALGPIILVAGLLVALTIGLINMANEAYSAKQGVGEFSQEISRLNSELSDLGKKENEIEKLTDRFDELVKKTAKTVEDIQEMDRLMNELGTYTYTRPGGNEEVFNLVTTDFAGNQIVDEVERQRLLDMIAYDRQVLEKERLEEMKKAVVQLGEAAFDDPNIANTARRVGYDAGIAFIKGFTGATDEQKNQIANALQRGLSIVDPGSFIKESDILKEGNTLTRKTLSNGQRQVELTLKNGTKMLFDTYAEFEEYARENNLFELIFDEEAFKEFSLKLTKTITDFYINLSRETDKINRQNLDKQSTMEQLLKARVEEYKKAMAKAQQIEDEQERKIAMEVIGATFADEKLLDSLINNEAIGLEIVAKLTLEGASAQEIESFLSQYLPENLDLTAAVENSSGGNSFASTDTYDTILGDPEELSADIIDAINTALEGGEQLEVGFVDFIDALRAAGYTDEEIAAEVIELSNIINNLTSQAAGELITSQMKTTQDLFNLMNDAAKGNFENFVQLAQEYGAEAVMALMGGDATLVTKAIEDQINETTAEIQESINELLALEAALKLVGEELSVADAAELATLQAMLTYYEDIALYTELRNFNLSQAKSVLKTINSLLEIQNTLLEIGAASGFVSFLGTLQNELTDLAQTTLGVQLTEDLNRLLELGERNPDGIVVFDPDTIDGVQFRAQLDNALETLNEFIGLQQIAFNQYKKQVTESYKAEIDAVKNAVSEKHKQIDYANRLAEAEEKVLLARRALAAAQLSGAGTSAMRQAEKDLKKIEQERRRIIEQQMADEAQKQLEAERDALIQAAQQEMVDSIDAFTREIVAAAPIIADVIDQIPLVLPPINDLGDKTEENTTAVIDNTTALETLNQTLQDMNRPITGRVAQGSGFVDSSVFFGV